MKQHEDHWNQVDDYIEQTLQIEDASLANTRTASDAGGLPQIQVSACQGKLLEVLARSIGAQQILEIGTLGGYSTINLARGLAAQGQVVTLEYKPEHAEVARHNLENAGFADCVDIRIGAALETLPILAAEARTPFDLVFIDADKVNIPAYLDWAIKLAHPGSLIIIDNVVRSGALLDETSDDPSTQGVRNLHAMLENDSRVVATTIQTVGSKGWDGLTFAVVA